MSISITTAEVKRKCMITTSDYDTSISALISEMQPALEYSIADAHLADTGNANLQATLKLGMLEIISGEFLEQLRREAGAAGQFSAGGVTLGDGPRAGADLVQQGSARLAPYLKAAIPMAHDTACSSTTSGAELEFDFDEEVL